MRRRAFLRRAAGTLFVPLAAACAEADDRSAPAREAHYVVGPNSPMGYNQAAHAQPRDGSPPFEAMAEQTAAAWPAHCRPAGKAT